MQVPQREVQPIDLALFREAQADQREQLHPLNDHLLDRVFPILHENVPVNLVEVHGGDERDQALEEGQEDLPLLTGPALRVALSHRLVRMLPDLEVRSCSHHLCQLLTYELFDRQ